MGTFVSDPNEELFDDKETAPGITLRSGWTEINVFKAENANALRDACYDLRDAVVEMQENGGAPLGDTAPLPLGSASAGVSGFASRIDHAHGHGDLAGGTLHAVAGASAGFMSATDKTKLDAISGTNTGDVSIGTGNGLSLVGQALSLAAAGASAGAMSAADKSKLDGIATGATVGVTAMAAVGAVPNANGASISSATLTLQPANATNPGVLTTAAQTIAGIKTFSSTPLAPGLTLSGTGANVITSNTTATAGTDTAFVLNATANLDTTSSHTDAILELQRNNGTQSFRFNSSGRLWMSAGANNGQPGLYFTTPSGGKALFRLSGGSGETCELIGDGNITQMKLGYACGTVSIGNALTELIISTTAVNVGAFNFTVDTNVLYVDATNDRIGIGTSGSANGKLEVAGSVNLTSGNVKTAFDVTLSAYRDTSTYGLTTTTYTQVAWNQTEIDTHSALSGTNTFTVPTGAGGKYDIAFSVGYSPATSTGTAYSAQVQLRKNGTSQRQVLGNSLVGAQSLSGSAILSLAAGDAITLWAWHSHPDIITSNQSGATHVSIRRLPGA